MAGLEWLIFGLELHRPEIFHRPSMNRKQSAVVVVNASQCVSSARKILSVIFEVFFRLRKGLKLTSLIAFPSEPRYSGRAKKTKNQHRLLDTDGCWLMSSYVLIPESHKHCSRFSDRPSGDV